MELVMLKFPMVLDVLCRANKGLAGILIDQAVSINLANMDNTNYSPDKVHLTPLGISTLQVPYILNSLVAGSV